MNELKRIKKFSAYFIPKGRRKKINSIRDKSEKILIFQNALISELRLKNLDLEIKIKQIKDKKKKHFFSLKTDILHSKITLLKTSFNEKDFKKIDSSLDKLKEEIESA